MGNHKKDRGVPLKKAGHNRATTGSKYKIGYMRSLELNCHYNHKSLHGCLGLQTFSVFHGQVYFAIKDSLKQAAG